MINWIGIVIVASVTLSFGVIASASPITILKAISAWFRFISPIFTNNSNFSTDLQERLKYIRTYPDEYSNKYRSQLTILRTTGFISLIIFLILICLLAAMLVNGPQSALLSLQQ